MGAKVLALGSHEQARTVFLDWCKQTERHIGFGTLIDVVRAAASTHDMFPVAIGVAELVRESLDTAHLDAEETANEMVKLARATYRFKPREASAYFTHVIDLTDRVGDDVHARWRALVKLANAASTSDDHDDHRAYRIAQIVEGLEPYLGDANHTDALTAIAHLSPTTAIAIASRWRDRRFCSEWPFIRALTAQDDSPLAPTPKVPLAMIPFEGANALQLLEQAIRHTPADGQRMARAIGEFVRHERFSPEAFEQLDHTVRDLNIDLDGTLLAPTARHVDSKRAQRDITSVSWEPGPDDERAEHTRQARRTLESCDLTTADGWEAARTAIAPPGVLISFEALADQAIHVRLDQLDDMLATFQVNPHFSTFDYKTLLDRVATLSTLPRAARTQLQHLAHHAVERFCRELTTKGYDPLDLPRLAQLATIDDDLLGAALRHLGSQPVPLGPEECFELAGCLASRLSASQAQVTFDDFADLMAHVAPNDSGDGEFDTLPAVPTQTSECIAGYIWIALGDPEAGTRWRAAHSVRLLVSLGCTDELDALHRYALTTLNTTPFTDTRLPFYDKHALHWLLLALARTATEPANHQALRVFTPLLKRVMFTDPPHVVHQASAKSALTLLAAAEVIDLTPDEQNRCQATNVPIGTIRQSWSDRMARTDVPSLLGDADPDDADDDEEGETTGFHFFMDFLDHWCEPLAEAFGLPKTQLHRRASEIVTERWQLPHGGKRARDPRHELKLYEGSKTYVYKSAWPEADDLNFYLAIHALWTVAGELVRDHPVYQDLNDDQDLFTEWLRPFLTGRRDGRWLADRRDPSPNSVFTNDNQAGDPDWIWRLASHHFAERLLGNNGWVTVWEHSDDTIHDAGQTVWIHSALVNREHARALLLALQTAPSISAFRLPDARDRDFQDQTAGFELTGWIVDHDHREGTDTRDPRAASISYPPPCPDDEIVSLLGLSPDADMREWNRAGEPVLCSTVWDDTTERSRGEETGRKGDRLQIRRDVLADLLTATHRSLIVTVMIDRTHKQHTQSYTRRRSRDDDDTFPYLERSFKVYLLDESGGCAEL